MMSGIEFTIEPIESIIEDYLEWSTDKIINSVDDLLKSLRDYLDDTNNIPEFNLDNIIKYCNIDYLDELDDLLTDLYVSKAEL